MYIKMEPGQAVDDEAAEPWPTGPDVVIISSGAIKGMMYVGALLELERARLLDNVEIYVGISVGAVISLLLCLNYSCEEIATVGKNTDVFKVGVENVGTGLMSIASTLGVFIEKAISNMGIYDKSRLEQPLIDLARNKLGYVPTLEQLYQYSGRELHAVTYCGETRRKVILNRHEFPNMLCTDAVVCSALVPLLLSKKQYQGLTYYDGYFADPYPMEDYDKDGKRVLGIYLNQQYDLHKHIDYIMAPLSSYQDMKVATTIKNSSVNARHLAIDCKNESSYFISGSINVKEQMIEDGQKTARCFIDTLRSGKIIKIYNGIIRD